MDEHDKILAKAIRRSNWAIALSIIALAMRVTLTFTYTPNNDEYLRGVNDGADGMIELLKERADSLKMEK